jgi:HK97 family phage prohead protease
VPYEIQKDAEACSAGEPYAVKKSDGGEVVGCHATEEHARKHLAALKANVEDARSRPTAGDLEERTATAETDGKRVYGIVPYDVVGDVGEFRERIERGALANTDFSRLKVVIDHQDRGLPLARFPATLQLSEQPDGLRWSFRPPESRADVIEALERGDIAGSSWRMRVAKDRWEADVRSIQEIAELVDLTLAASSDPVYPTEVEYRSRPATGQEDTTMSDTAQPANEPENQSQTEDRTADRDEERPRPPAGSLRVEDRTVDVRFQSLADLFADRGFFENRAASISWDEFRSFTWSAGTALIDLNPIRREGVALGYDQRWLFPVLPNTPVSDATTSVQYLRQSSRSLAGTATIRALDATSTKPETSTTAELATLQLNQVASVQTGVPRIHTKQPMFVSIVEQDLRLALNDGLDELVRRGVVNNAGTSAAVTGDILQKVRRARTVVEGNGYAPNILAIDPAGAENLDLLRSSGSEQFYLWGPGQGAPGGPFGLQMRIWKQSGTAILDGDAFGRMYASPVELRSFEADGGVSNKTNYRAELNAGYAIERSSAGLRIL